MSTKAEAKNLTFKQGVGFGEAVIPCMAVPVPLTPEFGTPRAWYEAMGYRERSNWPSHLGSLGHPKGQLTGIEVRAYEAISKDSTEWHYIADVWDQDAGTSVFVSDLPSLAALFAQLATQVNMNIAEKIEDIWDLMSKSFRANHGHAYYTVCRKCDPEEMDRLNRVAAARAK